MNAPQHIHQTVFGVNSLVARRYVAKRPLGLTIDIEKKNVIFILWIKTAAVQFLTWK